MYFRDRNHNWFRASAVKWVVADWVEPGGVFRKLKFSIVTPDRVTYCGEKPVVISDGLLNDTGGDDPLASIEQFVEKFAAIQMEINYTDVDILPQDLETIPCIILGRSRVLLDDGTTMHQDYIPGVGYVKYQ